MRFYLGSCEYKWSHKDTDMERIWVMREIGTDIYKYVEEHNFTWVLLRSQSNTLPDDIYCRCDIYVDTDENKYATLFPLKFPHVKPVEKIS
jgi:hypothetical protein